MGIKQTLGISLVLLLLPLNLYAAIGISFEAGGGSGSFDENMLIYDTDIDTSFGSIGFVYDSDPYAENGTFSYRLNIALEGRDIEDETGEPIETGGLCFDNNFAFSLARHDQRNIWFSPQLRLGFLSGETAHSIMGAPLEISGAMVGLGLVIGVNQRLNDTTGLSFSGGIRRIGYAGDMTWGGMSDDFSGRSNELFINIALLFK